MHVLGHIECHESLAEFTRLPWLAQAGLRTPIELHLHAPQAPGGPLDGLRGACAAELVVHAGEGALQLPCSSLPVDWLPDAAPLPPGDHAAFWALLVQRPEMLHRLLWLMSDHGLPRSWRTMALHGCGTWRVADAAGRARLARLQALPLAGLQALLRDEAERLAGVQPDVHARELQRALACGARVGFELALQLVEPEAAAAFPFDLLDATTLIPEEMAPLRAAGRILLERVVDDAAGPPATRAAPGFEPLAPARRSGDPFAQPALFWRSLPPVEQRHLVGALRVALERTAAPLLREAVVALLGRVDGALARRVADGLGFAPSEPPPPAARAETALPAGASAGLSLLARPGDGRLAGRRVALLVSDGVDAVPLQRAQRLLEEAQVQVGWIGARLGPLHTADGVALAADCTLEAQPSVCWDALVLPGGADALPRLCADGRVLGFVREQYRHAKPILLLARDTTLLRAAGVPLPVQAADDPGLVFPPPPPEDDPDELPDADRGPPLPLSEEEAEALLRRFVGALARHRHFERELDPPLV